METQEKVDEVLSIIKSLPVDGESSMFIYALADEIVAKAKAQGEVHFKIRHALDVIAVGIVLGYIPKDVK